MKTKKESTEPTKETLLAKKLRFLREHKTLSIICSAAIIVVLAVVLVFALRPPITHDLTDWVDETVFGTTPIELDTVVVPWNPGGTADLTARVLLDEVAPDVGIHNIHGANGADGLNEVFRSSEGETVLCTSLSSMVVADLTGFTSTSSADWEHWLTAYSPSIVAVAADSPYMTLDDLIAAAVNEIDGDNALVCADAGDSTLSYVAARLFAGGAGITVTHRGFSGTNPAVGAVRDGEADFIVALSSELVGVLRSGELRALASLSDEAFTLDGIGEIAPASASLPNLSDVAPFGEYFGMMLPATAADRVLRDYDKLWADAAAGEEYLEFTTERGMLPLTANRSLSNQTAARISGLIRQVFIQTGYISE